MKSSNRKSYLERLSFDPKLLLGPVASYIKNTRVVLLLAISIILIGAFSYLNLPKRLNPEVKIPIVSVSTVLPGASPEDIESLVTIPLENDLRGIKGLDTITSVSNTNISIISIQFASSVSQDTAKKEVEDVVNSFNSLPENAKTPKVNALDFEDQPVWTFAVTGTGDLPSLMNFSGTLKSHLTGLSKVDRVVTSGFETQEIDVIASPEKLAQFGINPLILSASLKKSVASYPAGDVMTKKNVYALTIDPSVTNIKDIRNIKINIAGHSVRLDEVAVVEERSSANQNHSYIATNNQTPQRAVTFYVYKSTSSNIDEAGKQIKAEVQKVESEYKNQFTVTTIVNTSEEISKQFTDLLGEFRSTIILVFVTLFLFLGLRQAIISSFTVPLTFLSAFFFMQVFGMSINFLSLFAFLLALGLLVDDTIVTVSAMTTYFRTHKFTPYQTGLLVWRDTIVPIWSTTITTIWSFIPLLLSTGIIGEFIKPIPIVVTITMLSSTAIAVLVTLPIMIVILKPNIPGRISVLLKAIGVIAGLAMLLVVAGHTPLLPVIAVLYIIVLILFSWTRKLMVTKIISFIKQHKTLNAISVLIGTYTNHGVIHTEGFALWYKRQILRILGDQKLRRRVVLMICLYALFSFLLLPMGFVKNEFFPKSDAQTLSLNLELPAGSTLENTEKESLAVLETLRHVQPANFVIAEVGKSGGGSFMGQSNADNTALFTLHLPPKEKRSVDSMTIARNLRAQFAGYSKGKISVLEASGGPPAGADIQIKLLGDNLGVLDTYADKLADFLKTQKGITNVNKSVKTGTSKIVFTPDYTRIADSGLTVDQLGLWMRLYASGITLDSVNFDKTKTDKEDVVFKLQTTVATPEGVSGIIIPSPQGGNLPLSALGSFVAKTSPTVITREGGKRTISVTASVTDGYSSIAKSKDLEKFASTLQLPAGYSWKTGGVNEENTKSVNSILQAMVIAFILILITMVIQFGSFRQALIVLIVIPLAVSSVFLIFALTGTPLSFPALIGVLSLFGIVVTNSMFIVDKINLNRKEGMPFKEAIADAGASRMEPIILTKLCTVFGLLPITLSNPLWRGLGGAIISGLLISSTIMLLFIPSLYYMWFKNEDR